MRLQVHLSRRRETWSCWYCNDWAFSSCDLENENDSSLCVDCLPNEVSCKLEVFSIHNEDLSNDDDDDDSSITYISCSPSSKKAKKGKYHKVAKWEKEHLNPKPTSKPEQHRSLSTFAGTPWECWIDHLVILWERAFRYCFFIGWRDKKICQ